MSYLYPPLYLNSRTDCISKSNLQNMYNYREINTGFESKAFQPKVIDWMDEVAWSGLLEGMDRHVFVSNAISEIKVK